eukprot:21567-Heterococcus_DN1.PRE.1
MLDSSPIHDNASDSPSSCCCEAAIRGVSRPLRLSKISPATALSDLSPIDNNSFALLLGDGPVNVKLLRSGTGFVRRLARMDSHKRQLQKPEKHSAEVHYGNGSGVASIPPCVQLRVAPDTHGNITFSFPAVGCPAETTPRSFVSHTGWEAGMLSAAHRCTGNVVLGAVPELEGGAGLGDAFEDLHAIDNMFTDTTLKADTEIAAQAYNTLELSSFMDELNEIALADKVVSETLRQGLDEIAVDIKKLDIHSDKQEENIQPKTPTANTTTTATITTATAAGTITVKLASSGGAVSGVRKAIKLQPDGVCSKWAVVDMLPGTNQVLLMGRMIVGEEVKYTVPTTLQKEPIKVQHLIRMLPHYDAIPASVAHTLHTCTAAVRQVQEVDAQLSKSLELGQKCCAKAKDWAGNVMLPGTIVSPYGNGVTKRRKVEVSFYGGFSKYAIKCENIVPPASAPVEHYCYYYSCSMWQLCSSSGGSSVALQQS